MKILCVYTDCGPSYVRSGWGRVFAALGHEFIFWRPDRKPAFDVFGEFDPDIFIGTTYDLDRATAKCIRARPHMKVALYASAWGRMADEIPDEEYPITRVRLIEKKMLEELKKEAGRPDFVFSHVSDRYLDGLLGGWRDIGIEPAGILNAADTFAYMGGTSRQEFACDVAFVGGYWPYKARNLDRYLLPLCHPSASLRVKIFGNQPWPVAQYLGLLDDEDARDVFASATVCPNVSEPHSTDFVFGYDVVERPFKVAAAGGFCISDYVEGMKDIFTNGEVPMFRDPKEFQEAVRFYAHHPEAREPMMSAARETVLARHTYFHRVAQMLELLGYTEEAERCLQLRGSYAI